MRKEAWTRSLRHLFATTSNNVVADIDLSGAIPVAATVAQADEGDRIALLGALLSRDTKPVLDGWAFVRGSFTASNARNNFALAAAWLAATSNDELRRLTGNGLSFAEMSPEGRALFARLCGNQGVQEKLAKGEFVRATVRLRIVARATDTAGQPRSLVVDSLAASSDVERDEIERQERTFVPRGQAKALSPIPLVRPRAVSASLDLHEGRLLTVGEAIGLANKAFDGVFIADGRLQGSTVYWQGRFTKESFVEALATVTTIVPSGEAPKPIEASRLAIGAALRNRIAKMVDPTTAPNGISYEDALRGRQVGVGDLAQAMPGLAQSLTSYNLKPDARLDLMPALSISLGATGSFRDPTHPEESPSGNVWSMVFLP